MVTLAPPIPPGTVGPVDSRPPEVRGSEYFFSAHSPVTGPNSVQRAEWVLICFEGGGTQDPTRELSWGAP